MLKKCFCMFLFMTVICCVQGQAYEQIIFGSKVSTDEPNVVKKDELNSVQNDSNGVQKADKIFVNNNNKVSLFRHITKPVPGEVDNPLKNNINSFFSSDSVNFMKLINDVMQKGECDFFVTVPKKGKVKFTIRSQPTFDHVMDAFGKSRSLPKEIATIGDRLAILVEFFSQHSCKDPEVIDLLCRNIHTFTIAVAILLQERYPKLKVELEEDGSLSVLDGSYPLKHKLSKLEVSYLNVREKENFKYGDSVDIATIASKLDHFINEKTESLNNASQINLYSYLPRIYKKFGEAISKIPSFQTTNIFFAKE